MQQNLSLQSTLHCETEEQRHFSGCQPLNFPSSPPNTWQFIHTKLTFRFPDCSSRPNSYFNCTHHCGQFLSCSHSCHFKQQRETKSIPLPLSFHQSSVCWHLKIMPAYPPCGCVSPHSISSILSLDSFLEFRVCCKSREEAPHSYVSFHSSFPLGNWLCFRGGHCKV